MEEKKKDSQAKYCDKLHIAYSDFPFSECPFQCTDMMMMMMMKRDASRTRGARFSI